MGNYNEPIGFGCSFNASQKDRGFALEGETKLPCSEPS